MNPQGGEGGNNQPPPPPPTAPIVGSGVGVSSDPSNPLAGLEGVVAAAKEAAAAQTTPKAQFENQFGSPQPTTPSVTDIANLGTPPPLDTSTPQSEPIQPVETLTQPEPEQTPAEKLKEQIANSVNAFLEEVLQKQGVAS